MVEGNWSWPIGVAIYVAGAISQALGANLQRKGLLHHQTLAKQDPTYKIPGKCKQSMWLFGLCLFIFSGIGMSAALFFASQTLLAPLQLVLFVSNAVFANLINKEPFQWIGWDGLIVCVFCIGVLMCVLGAPKETDDYDEAEMLDLMDGWGFILFVSLMATVIIVLWCYKRWRLTSCDWDPTTIKSRGQRILLIVSYGALAGSFGGVNVTLTKCMFSLVAGQWDGGGFAAVFSTWIIWVVLGVVITTYISQIVITVDGLEATSAIIVISTHSVTEEVAATLGGILFFEDYKHFETWMAVIFTLGTCFAIGCVVVLANLRLTVMEEEERKERELKGLAPADDDMVHASGLSTKDRPGYESGYGKEMLAMHRPVMTDMQDCCGITGGEATPGFGNSRMHSRQGSVDSSFDPGGAVVGIVTLSEAEPTSNIGAMGETPQQAEQGTV